ncbi:M48 family metallopeptidase [candidate division KSB1 bacterium]
MNIYLIIILTALILDFVLSIITDVLNLKALSDKLPAEFEGVYDEKTYSRSQEYTRVNTKFGFIAEVFGLIVTLVFWFSGGFNWLDQVVRGWFIGPIVIGLVYIAILVFAKMLISLPFGIYKTFVIEEKFEFNKTTPATFIKDIIKSLLLSIILGGPLIAGILWFFEYAGTLAWLYCWIASIVFILFIQYIAPTWIMPLFNKFTPIEPGELKDSILKYAESVKFSLKGVFVMDGSKRSAKSNAFFTGFGKNKRIALFDTLIKKHTVGELVAVLAHEIGHYKKKHIIIGMIISIMHMGVMFYLISIFISHRGLFDAFFMEEMAIYTGLIFFGMLFSPIEMILSIFMNIFSRRNEYQADRFAVETRDNKDDMIDALKKLSKDNLSNLTPHQMNVFLNYSHPPVLVRIEAIRNI